MSRYSAAEIEAKWQEAWDKAQVFRAECTGDKPKYYVLEMFPYPSGRIHMGHIRNYTMGDVIARHKLATGHNVLHPFGWDAFGLAAENAAIEKGIHPATWTYQNIADMKAQMRPLGFTHDWSREIATCHPEYYRHQQAMFIEFLEKGCLECNGPIWIALVLLFSGSGAMSGDNFCRNFHQTEPARSGLILPAFQDNP